MKKFEKRKSERHSNNILLPAWLALLLMAAPAITLAQNESANNVAADNVPMLTELEQEAMELRQSILTATEDERAAIAEQASEVMSKFDRRIDALGDNISEQRADMSAAAKEYSDELMTSLQDQREDVSEWMGELRAGTSDTWDHVVYQFSSAYDAFYESWEDVESNFGM